MRYRIGEEASQAALNSTDYTMLFTLAISVVIGVLLVWMGRRGKQLWLLVWGGGLVVCSLATFVWMMLYEIP